jgi:MFS family permease
MRWRLSVMMVLLWAVQGAFWPLLTVHLQDLGIEGRARGWVFATMALGSFAMPLGAGHLVDRLMPAQRFLALSYLVGTGFLVALAVGVSTRADVLFVWLLVYWLVTAPTPATSSTLAFRNLARPEEDFGPVRLWGTVGWMASGWIVTAVLAATGSSRAGQGTYEAFWIAAAFSLLMAAFSLTLPHTPPLAVGEHARTGLRDALDLIGQRDVAVYLATAFGVGLTTPFIYMVMPSDLEARGLPRAWTSTAMTLGQVPEIAMLAVLPWIFRRLDYKGALALGIAAMVTRFGILAADPPLSIAIAGIPLHGVGIACFVVGGQVFIDSRAHNHRRAGAQALLTVLTSGLGSLLGSVLAGEIVSRSQTDLSPVFLVPCVIDAALLIYFCASFRPDAMPMVQSGGPGTTSSMSHNVISRGTAACVSNLVTESADG